MSPPALHIQAFFLAHNFHPEQTINGMPGKQVGGEGESNALERLLFH